MKTKRTDNPEFAETIRLALRTARKSRNLSQAQAAIKFGVSLSAVKRWERELPREFAEFMRYIDALTAGIPAAEPGAATVKTSGLGVTHTLQRLTMAQGAEADPATLDYLARAGGVRLGDQLRFAMNRDLQDSKK